MNKPPDVRVATPMPRPQNAAEERAIKVVARDVNVFYGEKQALHDVTVDIPDRAVSAFIGPSGCGKSTFLRCINRMNDTILIARMTGRIEIDGEDIHDRSLDVVQFAGACRHGLSKAEPIRKIDL